MQSVKELEEYLTKIQSGFRAKANIYSLVIALLKTTADVANFSQGFQILFHLIVRKRLIELVVICY